MPGFLSEYLQQKVNPSFIILFGSYSHGSEQGECDIDLAFWSEQEQSSNYLFLMTQQLSKLFNIEVNLIDLKNASLVLQTHIFFNGTVIFSKNENLRRSLQMNVCSKYAHKNSEEGSISDMVRFKERRSFYD
ncbi:type VII toxin-antitoxin system MntA family adenylyltransferase antitoxin [Halobacillus massiliensis]|uniref:type VII toxin-antitoxin system MntA family adenylyltransferase antitoxin n=1 Tax=Halobacillus massiliensis TaxID=1926286 RepID=UPI00117BCA35